jgi:hypothetical protein
MELQLWQIGNYAKYVATQGELDVHKNFNKTNTNVEE